MSQSDPYGKFMDLFFNPVKDSVTEIYRLIPDSLLFGSIVLYFLTQNLAFGVFGIFIFETVVSHRVISWGFSQTSGPSRSLTADKVKCYSGFRTPQWQVDRIFQRDLYPAFGVFSITSIATYLLLAMNEFSETLQAMGWSSRRVVSYSLTAAVVVSFLLVRWFSECDSFGEIMIAIVFALIVGVIFFYVNRQLFGIEAMNFLGLPYLVSKEKEGSPIYVCAAVEEKRA